MSKIICDVCGTIFPETSEQCPICGCAKPANAQVVTGEPVEAEANGTYTYVKGGRFSKSNVNKRNKAMGVAPKQEQEDLQDGEDDGKSSTKGLVIVLIVLILAIAASLIYMGVVLFGGQSDAPASEPSTTETTQETTETTSAEIACTGITVADEEIVLEKVGDSVFLDVTPAPVDTTDVLTYASSDEKIIAVSAAGEVTAVAAGEATITIRCGDVVKTCKVICGNDATEETVDEEIETGEWRLKQDDITFDKKGSTYTLYKGDVTVSKITFTSDDEKVATFVDGVVTAVGGGTTKVHAEYNGKKESCIIRCDMAKYVEPEKNENTNGSVRISHTDVTIAIDESFNLVLRDSAGKTIDVSWASDKEGIFTISGNKITGAAAGMATVSVTHEGTTYSCIVRVNGSGSNTNDNTDSTDDGAVG